MKYSIIFLISFFMISCNMNNNAETVEVDDIEIKKDKIQQIIEEVHKTNEEEETKTDEEIILDIKEQFKLINFYLETDGLENDSINYECSDFPEYGEIVFHYNNAGLHLIEHAYSQGDHGGATDQYYIKDDELFFMFSDGGYWTFGGGPMGEDGNSPTIDYITEKRYYIDNERIVKSLEKKFEIKSASKNNPKSNEVSNKEIEASEEEKKEILSRFNKLTSIKGLKNFDKKCIWE